MPIYDYLCVFCNDRVERQVPIDERDQQTCSHCGFGISRLVSPTPGKVKGRADGKIVGGPDQFTADMLGMKVKELPASMRADKKR